MNGALFYAGSYEALITYRCNFDASVSWPHQYGNLASLTNSERLNLAAFSCAMEWAFS